MTDKPNNLVVFGGGQPMVATTSELAERIKSLVYEYSGVLPVAAAIGVLEIVKIEIMQEQ